MTRPRNLVLPIAGVIFGLPFLIVGLLGIRAGLATRNWVAAPGTVLTSERIGMGDHKEGRIEVDFAIGSLRYHCTAVHPWQNNTWEDTQAFPPGASTVVYYDPAQPGHCFLKPGVSSGSIVFVAVGLVLPILAFVSQAKNDAAVNSRA